MRPRTPATAPHACASSRFTTAQSPASCAANRRAFASRYSAKLAWRSRWSGVRFSKQPTCGRKRSTHSSWKLDTSTTAISGARSTAATSGVPRLPPVKVRRPARSSARPTRLVVVLLPLVPVMATSGHGSSPKASSISLSTAMPRRTAAASTGASRGTPGLGTTRSIPASRSGPSSPRRSSTPAGIPLTPRAAAGRASAARTRTPRAASAAATACPVRRKPSTRTWRGRFILAQLQGREREQRTDHRHDPEAHDDLRLGPAEELEVMVDGRHAEDALAPEPVGDHLSDHRERLDHEHAPHQEEHQLLAGDERDHAERRAERERADVAHEHLRRVGVEPEKAEAGGPERAAEDRELARAGHVGNLQVLGDASVPGGVGEDGVRPARDHDRPDGQTV